MQVGNAQWQRWLVALHWLLIALWAWLAWPHSPWWAAAGLVLVPLASRLLMLPQFLLMAAVRARAGEPRIAPAALLRGWWAESRWAALVFGWWQPFAAQAEPDWLPEAPAAAAAAVAAQPTARGVVLVHGFLCNRGFWLPWLRRLRAHGHPCIALTLEPPFASIDDYAPQIEAAVQRLQAATGQAPLVLAHSMGGLAVRAWLRAVPEAQARVQRVVTIGTPHGGTWPARHARSANGRQMRLDSAWLRQLARDEPPGRARLFECWRSDMDNVVYPDSAARLAGAREQVLAGAGHVELAFAPRIMTAVLALLEQRGGPHPSPPPEGEGAGSSPPPAAIPNQ
ncbi:hypothetical protein GCM10027019_06660 [Melaminivora jejuensis]